MMMAYCSDCGAHETDTGGNLVHRATCTRYTVTPIIIKDAPAPKQISRDDVERCYELLSALGDPVVVAEALPELVEAGAELADKAQVLRINCGGYRPERPTEKRLFLEDMKALLDAEDQWSDALAKLKARP